MKKQKVKPADPFYKIGEAIGGLFVLGLLGAMAKEIFNPTTNENKFDNESIDLKA